MSEPQAVFMDTILMLILKESVPVDMTILDEFNMLLKEKMNGN